MLIRRLIRYSAARPPIMTTPGWMLTCGATALAGAGLALMFAGDIASVQDRPERSMRTVHVLEVPECDAERTVSCGTHYDGVSIYTWDDGSTTDMDGDLWMFKGDDGTMYVLPWGARNIEVVRP